MPHTFTRQSLYDLVWSEPMQSVAGKFNLSDRGLAKACAAADIPVPERGYWAKLRAGKRVLKRSLPRRSLGMSDSVTIGASPWAYRSLEIDHLHDPIPPVPVFDTDMNQVRSEVTALVNKAPLSKSLAKPHRLIAGLLSEDEARRQKQLTSTYVFSWEGPIFDSTFERRRLTILNGLFTVWEHCRMNPHVGRKQARDLWVTVGDQRVSFSLDSANAEKQIERERVGHSFQVRGEKDKMRLSLSSWRNQQQNKEWQDRNGDRIENHLREIAIELVVAGEESYRQGLISHREWLIDRKAAAQEAERKRILEDERRQREREAKLERDRVEHLLAQARELDQATQIRTYVAAVRRANESSPDPVTQSDMAPWANWALAQADRIDPIVSGRYRTRPNEAE